MRLLLMLFVAGGFGTLARYGLTRWLWGRVDLLWATLTVNCLGSLACGFAWGAFEAVGALDSRWRVVALVGFLGALTTFSTFALETVLEAQNDNLGRACLNVLATNLAGILSLVAGLFLARLTCSA